MTDPPARDGHDHSELLRVWRAPHVDGFGGVLLHVAGEIDLLTAPELADYLAGVVLEPPGPLVIDLTDVFHISSSGLTVLVDQDQRCREEEVELRVVTGNPNVSQTIEMTGLDELLTVFGSLPEAVRGRS